MGRVVSRHVAHIEAHGRSTPERRHRQRKIIAAASQEYRTLPEAPANVDPSLIASFAFSTKTTAADALARLVGILDGVDPEWRDYVRAWDGWGREDDAQPQLADPPITGWATGNAGRDVGVLDRLRAVLRR
jgi:hypothetical protein